MGLGGSWWVLVGLGGSWWVARLPYELHAPPVNKIGARRDLAYDEDVLVGEVDLRAQVRGDRAEEACLDVGKELWGPHRV